MSIFARFLTFRHLVKLVAKFFSKEEVKNFDLNSSIFQDVNVDEVAESMKSNGLHLGINLPKPAVQEILDFCAKTNCYGDAEHQLGFIYTEKAQAEQKCGKTFNMAQYFNINSLCPIINKLAKDPVLLEIATQYLGTNQCIHEVGYGGYFQSMKPRTTPIKRLVFFTTIWMTIVVLGFSFISPM